MMDSKLKLVILAPAQRELEEIAQVHYGLSGAVSARNITNQLYSAMEQLIRFPHSGPAAPDGQLRDAGYRYILTGKYLAFYKIIGDTVYVYHIVHGATDYPKLLKESTSEK